MSAKVVVISMHEKGFPMADYYDNPPDNYGDEWPPPDAFLAGSVNESLAAFAGQCRARLPGVRQIFAEDD